MKIGIICFWDRYATPYLSKYERLLEQQGIDYEVIFWNRLPSSSNTTIVQKDNVVYIDKYCREGLAKSISFIGWRRECIKILRQKKYDNLIILSTVPAILLQDYIIRHYKGRYIFDIRDYTLESNRLFRKMVMKLIENSTLTPISSKGFLRWLEPSSKIMINHNITVDSSIMFDAPSFSDGNKVKVSFVGNVRLDTQTKAMMLSLGKSDVVEQHFYGRILPTCDIEHVTNENGLTNVVLHGSFDNSEKVAIYKNTDLINTVYANAVTEDEIPLGDSTPLPNRLYDALVFYRPLVTSKGTYLAELVDQYRLGVNVNGFDVNVEQEIIDYTRSFDAADFKAGCDELRQLVLAEEAEFVRVIKEIFTSWK